MQRIPTSPIWQLLHVLWHDDGRKEFLEQLLIKNGITPTIQYSIIEWKLLPNSIFLKFSLHGNDVSEVVQILKSNGLKYPLGKIQLVHELYRKNKLVHAQ